MSSRVFREGNWRSALAAALFPSLFVLALVVSISVAGFAVIRGWERRNLQNEFSNLARNRVDILHGKMLGSMEVLQSIAQLFSSNAALTRAGFENFVSDALARHPEIQALSWNPRVPGPRRGLFEAQARREGLPDFEIRELDGNGRLTRAGAREEYVPVYFETPLEKNRASLGFDLASNRERGAALAAARDTGSATTTQPLRLVQETGNQMGFVVVLPIYGGGRAGVEERRSHLIGYASAVFRTGDLVEFAWKDLGWRDMDVSIHCVAGRRMLIYRHGFGESDAGVFHNQAMDVAGGLWQLTFTPTPRFLASHILWQAWAALAAGLTIAFLVGACLWGWLRRSAEIEQRVVERTAQLRTAEKKYRSIFENSVEGIFQTTRDGRYISANPALARIYGYGSPWELIAALDDIERQLYIEPERRKEFMRAVQEDGEVSSFESQVRRKDGSVIWISEKARAVRGEEGEVLYYEGAVEDVTGRKAERQALEERVRERTAALQAEIIERKRAEDAAAAANKAKTSFLAHMSHEIRTPLNAVLGYAQILQRDKALPPEHRRAIEAIANSGAHLFGLIDDVLDISKIEAGRMELQLADFSLAGLVRRLEAMFRHRCEQKRLRFSVTRPAETGWVRGDEGKLRQVLINILGNAVKFTERGEISLRVGKKAGGVHHFEVADTGIGMDEEEQARVTAPFSQGAGGIRKGGSGLGLAISKRQIELMGGELRFQSEAGAGSRFSFSLPLPGAGVLPGRTDYGTARLAPGCKINALVVDDIEENRTVLAGLLSAAGCGVLTAENGQQALEIVRVAAPDIIFMDIWMPGMNGIETTHAILAEGGGKARIIAHSASAFDHEQRRYLDAGFDDFFAKPFRYERVCECLAQHLQARFEQEPPPVIPPPGDFALPEELALRLKAAAELYNVTAMKACLGEAALLGDGAKDVADHLLAAVHRCDIDLILEYLA